MLLLVSSACLCYNFGLCWLWAHIAVLCYDYLIISLCSAFVSAVFVIPHPQAAQAQNQQQFLVPLPEVSFVVRTITSQTYQFHHVVFEANHDNQSLRLTKCHSFCYADCTFTFHPQYNVTKVPCPMVVQSGIV